MRQILQKLVDKALKERQVLDLHIPRIKVEIGLFQTNQLASGYPTKDGSLLILNLSLYEREEGCLELIRREIERLSIFEAKINEELLRINEEEQKLHEEFRVSESKEKEKELAKVKKEKIKNMLYVEPINECCFLVFCFIPYNGWEELRRDPEGIKKSIVESFQSNIFSYGERFTEILLIDAYTSEEINEKTCKYVWDLLYYGDQDRERESVAKDEEVNVELAKQILKKVSEYQVKVNENARKAAECVVKGYVENPSRLKRAYEEASSYNDFLACLMHD